ncbi:hypothetical protein [Hymenobacter sp. PAMC 26628]|uniref:hypothetical protein n=1 Tax=Hymenobacter sp. PAMC 26628 TaxID=1484118 RepID=UPI00076FF931|nr:hypothetical protein [Hymenobacter sp. PAMC 26628]AMJ67190.1 hypothetical protein AXW84_18465 [Hymenobacter sp. PAMC 26628]
MATLPKRAHATAAQTQAIAALTQKTGCAYRIAKLRKNEPGTYAEALARVGNLYLETHQTIQLGGGLCYCVPDNSLVPVGLPQGSLLRLEVVEWADIWLGDVVVRARLQQSRVGNVAVVERLADAVPTLLEAGVVLEKSRRGDHGPEHDWLVLYRGTPAGPGLLKLPKYELGCCWYRVVSTISSAS